jgi:SLAP domain-containing protein
MLENISVDTEERASLSNKSEWVFVYGTLRKDEYNDNYLADAECITQQCWTFGKLYDTGLGFPVLVVDQSEVEPEEQENYKAKVIGELYRVTAEVLQKLDQLEGYSVQGSSNMYERIRWPIRTEQGVSDAFVYVNSSLPIEEDQQILSGDWKAYQRSKEYPHTLVLHETWERAVSDKDRELFHELFYDASSPKVDYITFLAVRAGINYEGNLFATVLIQNGKKKDVIMDNIPLVFEDAHSMVAEYRFAIKDVVVNANTSTPWTFIFPKETIKKDNIDLSSWTLRTL